jgi:CO dehydrogenase/acetyl-CoA synthase gamma subunit (corrinoid Fe-S protein)
MIYRTDLEYFTTTNVWVSVTDFMNEGLELEEIVHAIRQIQDLCSTTRLSCRQSGIRGTVIIETSCKSEMDIYITVREVAFALSALLESKEE